MGVLQFRVVRNALMKYKDRNTYMYSVLHLQTRLFRTSAVFACVQAEISNSTLAAVARAGFHICRRGVRQSAFYLSEPM